MTIEQQKNSDEEQEFVEVNNLSDISIDRLDLVGSSSGGGPAIGRSFFLLKSRKNPEGEVLMNKFTEDVDNILQALSKGSEDVIVEATALIANLKKSLEDEKVEVDKDKAQGLIDGLEKALKDKDEVSDTMTTLVTGLKGLVTKEEETVVDTAAEEALKASELSDEVKAQLLESLKKQAEEVKKAEAIKDEAYQARIQKAEDEAKSAKDEIAKMVHDNRKAEWIAKAADYSHISGSAKDIGTLLMSIEEVSPETAEKVENLLKSAEVELKESQLFKELGTSVQVDANSAEGKAEVLAKAKLAEGDITIEQARAEVWVENPGLYEEYNRDFNKKVR